MAGVNGTKGKTGGEPGKTGRMEDEASKSKKSEWESLAQSALREVVMTESGLPIKLLYTPDDLSRKNYQDEIGYPGLFPYTRGVYPTMYRGRLWTMRQFAGFGTAKEANARFKFLLSQGQTALSVAFDLPTQMGLDSDHPLAEGEVGRVGVAIDTLMDFEALFDGIPIETISTNFTINATSSIILAMYIALGESRGIPSSRLAGTLQNDILKEYIARNTYIFPPKPSLKLVVDVIEYCSANLPKFHPISITGYHSREAGATALQELTYTFAAARAYVREVLARGIDIDSFAPRLSFHFAATQDIFEEVAKFRAARRMWARMMKEEFGAKDPRSWTFRVFSGGSGASLTRQEPLNNVVRSALQVLAAVLGGAQSIHSMAYDEAYSIPSKEAVTLALRSQQIIAYESGVTRTVDPLGGSYFIEKLTDEFEEEATKRIHAIEEAGGFVSAVDKGLIQKEIADSAYRMQKSIESGSKVVVGVNRFGAARGDSGDSGDAGSAQKGAADAAAGISADDFSGIGTVEVVDPVVEQIQKERLSMMRSKRSEREVAESLKGVEKAALSGENVVPAILRAVKAYATVGEITDVMRQVFGEYRERTLF